MFKTMLSNFRSAFASSTGKICLGLFYTPLSSTNIKFYKKNQTNLFKIYSVVVIIESFASTSMLVRPK